MFGQPKLSKRWLSMHSNLKCSLLSQQEELDCKDCNGPGVVQLHTQLHILMLVSEAVWNCTIAFLLTTDGKKCFSNLNQLIVFK